MPNIVSYLDQARLGRYYDDDDLAVMQSAYERLCAELHVALENKRRRETIAVLTFSAYDHSKNPEQLYRLVLNTLRDAS